MIITGEASGDLHGANLVRAIAEKRPNYTFFGMGGDELQAAGVEMLYDAARLSVVGITEVIGHLADILAAKRILTGELRKRQPDLLILIDFPDFNLMLAKKAKQYRIPVLYYISPQVWAWRKGRTAKIGRLSDRRAVILPFEKVFYRSYGVDVDFVGHPLMDTVRTTMSKSAFRQSISVDPDAIMIGLLPGSRRKEIATLLPDFLAAARILQKTTDKEITFVIPRASTISRDLLVDNGVGAHQEILDIRIIEQNRYDLMASCDAVVAASGTVTLELAILGTPTVTTYRLSPRSYYLARLLIKLEHFSLVNLIAGRQVITELLQDEVTAENIAAAVSDILQNDAAREIMLKGLDEVRKKLGSPGASSRTADLAIDMVENQ